jgi:AcrR family transcriptional regulator
MEFKRARSPEHKQQRYDAIVAAARELASRHGVRGVSLTDIAAEVGMHKSALLRYFTTRDEIYLRIAVEDWVDAAHAIRHALAGAPTGSVTAVATAFADALAARPLFCDLLAHVPLNLERTVPLQSVLEYKQGVMPAVDELLGHVRVVLPDLSDADLLDLTLTTSAVAATLHQQAYPPPTFAQLYREHPELVHVDLEFAPTLRRIVETFLRGLRG